MPRNKESAMAPEESSLELEKSMLSTSIKTALAEKGSISY